jgi:hypothetical protein
MTPEQQSEMKKREEKKSFATACAHSLVVHLAPVMESATPQQVGKRVELLPTNVPNADRIVACVNACKGIKDPAQAIRDAIHALGMALSNFSGADDSEIREAISALGGAG